MKSHKNANLPPITPLKECLKLRSAPRIISFVIRDALLSRRSGKKKSRCSVIMSKAHKYCTQQISKETINEGNLV